MRHSGAALLRFTGAIELIERAIDEVFDSVGAHAINLPEHFEERTTDNLGALHDYGVSEPADAPRVCRLPRRFDSIARFAAICFGVIGA